MAKRPETLCQIFKLLYTHEGRDSMGDVRNVLLVVAALIAAVTFQAGVSPPGGVWQDTSESHVAGQAIYASQEVQFLVFVVCNTLALSSSINLIIALTWGFPFFLEVMLATVSMILTYGSAIFAVTINTNSLNRWLLFTGLVPFLLRPLIEIGKYYRWHMSK